MSKLIKALGFKTILLITINSIIGSGLFFLPAIGARLSGPSSLIAWVILGFLSLWVALSFGELVSMFPEAGGIYEFSKQAYGRFVSFIVGWMAWIVGNVTTAMLIVGAITYLLPYNTTKFIIAKMIICIFWVVMFNYFTYRGVKTSAFLLVTFSIITLALIVALIVPSLFYIEPSNLSPFFVKEGFLENFSLILLTVFFISETFFGLESVCFLAEETKNPKRDLPKALITSVIAISILAFFLVMVSLMVVPWEQFGASSAPFADLGAIILGSWFGDVVAVWTYLVVIGAAAGWIVTGPRLVLAMTRDKLFLPHFGKIHPEYNTPSKAILFQAIATIVFVIISFKGTGYETLLAILIPIVLFMTFLVLLIVPILRIKMPAHPRPFKMPAAFVGSILVAIFHLFLIYMWLTHEHGAFHLFKLGISFITFGIPIYLLIEMYHDPKMITSVNDFFAYITLITEKIFLPVGLRKEIVSLLGDISHKNVLEFGCSVGSLTMLLAEMVGPDGKVYATDLSEKELKITRRRIHRMGHKHVDVLHDPYLHSRVHSFIPKVDCIVSIGMIGYLQQVEKVIKGLNRRLDVGKRIVIVDYDHYFYFIPNIPWLAHDSQIKKLFDRCGFNVGVIRKQGLMWQYIYIYGIKERDVEDGDDK